MEHQKPGKLSEPQQQGAAAVGNLQIRSMLMSYEHAYEL